MQKNYKFILQSSNKNKFISFYLIIRMFFFRKLSFLDKKYYKNYLNDNKENLNFKAEGKYSQDWFSYNIKYISRIIYKYQLNEKNLNILEIGSYEGLSTVFFLTILKKSRIYCVDPFMDFTENKDKNFDLVYENFIFNTKKFSDRLKLVKTDSDNFFKSTVTENFDLIYIDGSHHAENVLRDANNSFKVLKKNGFIIFDDFMWDYHSDPNDNPIGAIKEFIKDNFFKLQIVSIGYQLIIKKISD